MKRWIGLLIFILSAANVLNCGPQIPTACEEESEKKQRRCEETVLLASLLTLQHRSPAAQQSATPTVNYIEESAYQLNGTFAVAQDLPLPTALTIQSISGRVNTEGDVDIYMLSYASGSAPALIIDASKPGTPATCAAYTRFGASALDSATPDGSLLSVGNLTAAGTPVVLDRVSRTHFYLRCSGSLNETYTMRLAYSPLNL